MPVRLLTRPPHTRPPSRTPARLQISPGIPELVALLKEQGKQVFLVSGGFRIVIHPIAEVRGWGTLLQTHCLISLVCVSCSESLGWCKGLRPAWPTLPLLC